MNELTTLLNNINLDDVFCNNIYTFKHNRIKGLEECVFGFYDEKSELFCALAYDDTYIFDGFNLLEFCEESHIYYIFNNNRINLTDKFFYKKKELMINKGILYCGWKPSYENIKFSDINFTLSDFIIYYKSFYEIFNKNSSDINVCDLHYLFHKIKYKLSNNFPLLHFTSIFSYYVQNEFDLCDYIKRCLKQISKNITRQFQIRKKFDFFVNDIFIKEILLKSNENNYRCVCNEIICFECKKIVKKIIKIINFCKKVYYKNEKYKISKKYNKNIDIFNKFNKIINFEF